MEEFVSFPLKVYGGRIIPRGWELSKGEIEFSKQRQRAQVV